MGRRWGKLETLPSGNIRASYSHKGQRHFAPITFGTTGEAETWLATVRTDIVRGAWSADKPAMPTVRDYALAWFAGRDDLRPRTVALYSSLLDRLILPALGALRVDEVTPAVVRGWHSSTGGGARSRSQAYGLLRGIMGQAVRDGMITANPCQIRGAASTRARERGHPSIPQILALADAVPSRWSAMVLVAAFGGLRFSELGALTRADIDLTGELPVVSVSKQATPLPGGRWTVGPPKTEAGVRTVALPAFLRAALVEHLGAHVPSSPDARVFATRTGRPLRSGQWSVTFRAATRACRLPDYHAHDLRHAAATLAAQSGATLKDAMGRLGHSSPAAALRYQHAAADRDRAIAAALDVAVAAAGGDNVVELGSRRRSEPA